MLSLSNAKCFNATVFFLATLFFNLKDLKKIWVGVKVGRDIQSFHSFNVLRDNVKSIFFSFLYLLYNNLNPYTKLWGLYFGRKRIFIPPSPLGNLYFFPKKTAWFSRNIADDKIA